MTTQIKRTLLLLVIVTFPILASVGCNTAHGFGKDVEKTGEKIQEGTK